MLNIDPLYTDTRYNDKFRHNANLIGMKISFKSYTYSEIIENEIKLFNTSRNMFWIFVRIVSLRRF